MGAHLPTRAASGALSVSLRGRCPAREASWHLDIQGPSSARALCGRRLWLEALDLKVFLYVLRCSSLPKVGIASI